MGKYSEQYAINKLHKRGCFINPTRQKISIPKSISLGNRSWGLVDYLVNYCGYRYEIEK